MNILFFLTPKLARTRHLAMALLLGVSAFAAQAADAQAGRGLAQACAVCHGPKGISATPDAPNLAGQPSLYLSTQLSAYRAGVRKHEVMSVMAKNLSDADIANLAAWYSGIQVEATLP